MERKEAENSASQTLNIPGRLPGMNELINANRISKWAGSKQKKDYTNKIAKLAKSQLEIIECKVDVTIKWYCKDRRRDKDNIMAGAKFIFDGLQEGGIIKNDGWNEIGDINHLFYIDKENERAEVIFKKSIE